MIREQDNGFFNDLAKNLGGLIIGESVSVNSSNAQAEARQKAAINEDTEFLRLLGIIESTK